jgi:chaperonin GroEL
VSLKTNIVSNEELKSIMTETLGFLSDTLRNTLGPYGTTTIIQDRMLNHQITKDGYSLLKKIYIEEEEARTILDMVKKISRNLVRKVGDGSTSSIIIANSLYRSISDLMSNYNIPAKDLLQLLNNVAEVIASAVKANAKPVSDDMAELEPIAAVSTNNDLDYGKLITEIFREVGKYGFISLEKAKGDKTYYEVTNGFEIPRGMLLDIMANQPDEKTCELHTPYIFLCDDMITEKDLPFIADLAGDLCGRKGESLVFVAKGFDNAAATFFHINITRNQVPIMAVELAMENKKNKDRFRDLEINLGAKAYRKSEGETLSRETFDPEERLGRCKKVLSTDTYTRFIEGGGDKEQIEARVKLIQDSLEEKSRNESYIEMDDEIFSLRKRMASLQNSMAVLYVGGVSEDAKDTDKYLLEDAVFACRSALHHGYIPGGNLLIPTILEGEKTRGYVESHFEGTNEQLLKDTLDNIKEAFLQSFICVLENAYHDEERSRKVAETCTENGVIFNLKQNRFEAMTDTPIINSAETDIEILRSAISIIGLLVTSNQFIKMNVRH